MEASRIRMTSIMHRQWKKGLTTLLLTVCLALAATPAAWGQSLDEAAQAAGRAGLTPEKLDSLLAAES